MQKQEFDMEVTEYRKFAMMETLERLLADQRQQEIVGSRHFRVDENGKKLEELTPRKAVI